MNHRVLFLAPKSLPGSHGLWIPPSPKDALATQKSVPIVYSEDNSSGIKKNDMEAMAACTKDDVLFRNWLIRFINSQMLLKGLISFFNCCLYFLKQYPSFLNTYFINIKHKIVEF